MALSKLTRSKSAYRDATLASLSLHSTSSGTSSLTSTVPMAGSSSSVCISSCPLSSEDIIGVLWVVTAAEMTVKWCVRIAGDDTEVCGFYRDPTMVAVVLTSLSTDITSLSCLFQSLLALKTLADEINISGSHIHLGALVYLPCPVWTPHTLF
jgi:hypothetical protein